MVIEDSEEGCHRKHGARQGGAHCGRPLTAGGLTSHRLGKGEEIQVRILWAKGVRLRSRQKPKLILYFKSQELVRKAGVG